MRAALIGSGAPVDIDLLTANYRQLAASILMQGVARYVLSPKVSRAYRQERIFFYDDGFCHFILDTLDMDCGAFLASLEDRRTEAQHLLQHGTRAEWEAWQGIYFPYHRAFNEAGSRMQIKLRIEDGIVLREYFRAWTPKGWGHRPRGWTPDDSSEWVRAEVQKALDTLGDSTDELTDAERDALRATVRANIATKHGEVVHQSRRPWRGWVPASHADPQAKQILKAYRKLLRDLNPDEELAEGEPVPEAVWPEDGFYVIDKKVMVRVEG